MNRDHLESEHIAKYADEREPCPIRECPLRERMQTAERKSDMMGVYRWIVGVLLGLLLGVGGSWFTDLRKAVQRDEVTIMIYNHLGVQAA